MIILRESAGEVVGDAASARGRNCVGRPSATPQRVVDVTTGRCTGWSGSGSSRTTNTLSTTNTATIARMMIAVTLPL
jgi:hypothetical protein